MNDAETLRATAERPGRYIDRSPRRNGRWGLDKRIASRDFDEIRDVVAMFDHDTGRRDRSDPSYAVLRDP